MKHGRGEGDIGAVGETDRDNLPAPEAVVVPGGIDEAGQFPGTVDDVVDVEDSFGVPRERVRDAIRLSATHWVPSAPGRASPRVH
ncbi:hypothetical protein [Arthrobacter sp. UYCu712]|uniref:hypothetical protein n=1 Tax=Arthrobacter sp. UYCu712 TaxID=3156340 RepID=UPI00339404CA